VRTIVLVHDAAAGGGRADASDVLAEAEHVASALERLGYATATWPVSLDLAALERSLARLEPHAVFNLMESIGGRGELIHLVPSLLESLGVPFTGCSADAQRLTSNKLLAKRQLARAGLPAPAEWTDGTPPAGAWIVKSVWEHASIGIDDASVVEPAAVPAALAARRARYGGRWFAERYIDGREINVGVVATPAGPTVLPAAQIEFEAYPQGKPRIVGYAAKWHAESFEYRHTPRRFGVEPALAARTRELALECWRIFALDGYARVDFRVDAAGAPWVLEVNANPCLSPDAGFAAMLEAAGIDYAAAIGWLIEDARRRAG
jgi:D-alanine-D-alanine ligase